MDDRWGEEYEGVEVPMRYSLFNGITVHPLGVEGPLEELMVPVPVRPGGKRRQLCWSPTVLNPPYRANENVVALSAVVMDIDECPDYTALVAGVAQLPYGVWLYPTASFKVRGGCRGVAAFSELLPPQQWVLYYGAVLEDFRRLGVQPDPQCIDASRLYVRPLIDSGPLPSYNGRELAVNLHYTQEQLHVPTPIQPTTYTPTHQHTSTAPFTTIIHFDTGELHGLAECRQLPPGKYRCTCPYQVDASSGSAFLRVTPKRGVLVCTSQRHSHGGTRWVLWGPNWGRPGKQEDPMKNPKWVPDDTSHQPPDPEVPGGDVVEDDDDRTVRARPALAQDIKEDVVYHRGIQKFVVWNPARRGWNLEAPMGMESMKMWMASRTTGCDSGDLTRLTIEAAQRAVEDTTFIPWGDRVIGDTLNLWCAPDPLPPASKDFPRIRKILSVICSGDKLAAQWLVHWMAALVQQPQKVGMTAVVVKSHRQGIGKTLLGEILERILGENNCAVVSNQTLGDNFNAAFAPKVFIRGEEISYAGDPGLLKLYITGNRVPFRAPHANRTEIVNRMTWYFTSNNVVPIPLDEDDRRFTVFEPLDVPPGHKEMLEGMFDEHRQMKLDTLAEVAAFEQYLRAVNVDWVAISKAYATDAKVKIQSITTDSTGRFLREMEQDATFLHEDCMGKGQAQTTTPLCGALWLYRSYQRWCTEHGERWVPEGTFRLQVSIYDHGRIQYGRGRIAGRTCAVYSGFTFNQCAESHKAVH